MPRLSNTQYLQAHHDLQRLWQHDRAVFAELTPVEQWQLHDFFRPSKDLTDEQLLTHRRVISQTRPSLPQQAGRALHRLEEYLAVRSTSSQQSSRVPAIRRFGARREHHIVVKAVVRPEIDVDKLVRLMLEVARAEDRPDRVA
jgi:hypothetical protein